jgi:hypothetical protein
LNDARVVIGSGDVTDHSILSFGAVVQLDEDGVTELEFAEAIEDAGDGVPVAGFPVDVAGEDGVAVPRAGGEVVPGNEVGAVGDLGDVRLVDAKGLDGSIEVNGGHGEADRERTEGSGLRRHVADGLGCLVVFEDLLDASFARKISGIIAKC